MYKQFQEGNTFRGKAGPCGQPSQNPTTPCRHTHGFCLAAVTSGQSPAGLTHLQSHVGQLWLWSSNLQLLPRPEGSGDRRNPNRSAGVGCGPAPEPPGSSFTYVQSTALAVQGHISCTWHERAPKMSQKQLCPRRCVKSCLPRGEGSRRPLGAGGSVGFLRRTKCVYMDHALVPAHQECLRVLISPLVCCFQALITQGTLQSLLNILL